MSGKATGVITEDVVGAPRAFWFVRWSDLQDVSLMPATVCWETGVLMTKEAAAPLPRRSWREDLEEYLAARALW